MNNIFNPLGKVVFSNIINNILTSMPNEYIVPMIYRNVEDDSQEEGPWTNPVLPVHASLPLFLVAYL